MDYRKHYFEAASFEVKHKSAKSHVYECHREHKANEYMSPQSTSWLIEASLAIAKDGSCPNGHQSVLQYVASYLFPPPSLIWSFTNN